VSLGLQLQTGDRHVQLLEKQEAEGNANDSGKSSGRNAEQNK
jgi:hypothetical protein